ncbi:MAG: hypothetical protein N2201_03180, partial [candidate division WOR-3 bacterium]|nr:hypothetical protein [candidate division WOR-3 bacterium]
MLKSKTLKRNSVSKSSKDWQVLLLWRGLNYKCQKIQEELLLSRDSNCKYRKDLLWRGSNYKCLKDQEELLLSRDSNCKYRKDLLWRGSNY